MRNFKRSKKSPFTTNANTSLFTENEMVTIAFCIKASIDNGWNTLPIEHLNTHGKVFIDFYENVHLGKGSMGKINFTPAALDVALESVNLLCERIENGKQPDLEHIEGDMATLYNKIYFTINPSIPYYQIPA